MRKVIVTEFLSLDGVMEAPEWTFRFFGDEQAAYKLDELRHADALLLGRVTYEGFAEAWPSRTDEQGFADRMNSLPKYVASRTPRELTWNNAQLLPADVPAAVRQLKAQPGQAILVYGSGQLLQTLMAHDLVDEYRLMVFPLVLGTGQRLFREGRTAHLRLTDTRTFSTGVTVLTYEPARND